ncbi:MAG: type II toxin-antitoxin system death-on-curing family toxin [Candidatus Aenigmatarchaeota archaeon]
MAEIKYLTKEEIVKIHEEIIEKFGGTQGLLNEGLLDLVLDQMRISKDIIQKSIILLFGIIQDHPFLDGNKRTALESFYTFLNYNSINLEIKDINETESIILKIAKNEISRNIVRKWIESLICD